MPAVRTQCEVLDVGKYSNPSFGPFSQVFGSVPGFFWLPRHLGCGIFELSTISPYFLPCMGVSARGVRRASLRERYFGPSTFRCQWVGTAKVDKWTRGSRTLCPLQLGCKEAMHSFESTIQPLFTRVCNMEHRKHLPLGASLYTHLAHTTTSSSSFVVRECHARSAHTVRSFGCRQILEP